MFFSIVSILILLDYLFLSLRKVMDQNFNGLFQSLFYWITYSYRCMNKLLHLITKVSILILLDYLFLLVRYIYSKDMRVPFQSLFYWITYSYFRDMNLELKGMNMFQSLFYWITYSYNMIKEVQQINEQFQSLFYWITYSYFFSIRMLIICRLLFQSLFYWITYSYIYSISCLFTINKVSILILLDYLFL